MGNAERASTLSQHDPQLPQRRDSIPKGLRHEAQGCEERATLGEPAIDSQPQRGCGHGGTEMDAVGIGSRMARFATRRNPFRVAKLFLAMIPE